VAAASTAAAGAAAGAATAGAVALLFRRWFEKNIYMY
jgi:hypothetical protein